MFRTPVVSRIPCSQFACTAVTVHAGDRARTLGGEFTVEPIVKIASIIPPRVRRLKDDGAKLAHRGAGQYSGGCHLTKLVRSTDVSFRGQT